MRIGLDVLRRWVDLPDDPHRVRVLLDECGLEVKRVEGSGADTCFTLELLANRGDHHCYEGVARELYGRLGTALRIPEVRRLEVGEPPVPVRIETDLCLVYTATELKKVGGGELDAAARRILVASGQGSVSPAVDASNVTNLELGQPTHAFDADTLDGGIVVRPSRKGERCWPLFQPEPVEVPEGTLVIADERKILGIAGVIGCEESKTTERTTRIVLESATFDPVAVRKASRALRIGTDASARFERGADPARPLIGAGRVADLLAPAGWEVRGAGRVGRWEDRHPTIPLDPARARAFLQVDLGDDDQVDRLVRYGFRCRPVGGRLEVEIPTWRRWDVEYVADLYEELAKSVGYENTPIALPPIDRGAVPSPREARRTRVEEVLLANGFYEVFTDGFYGRDVFALLGLVPGDALYDHVQTTNALDRAYSLLKNNALHQALLAVGVNERRRTADPKMYEWTTTFHPRPPDGRTTSPASERSILWGIAAGRDRPKGWVDTARPADAVWVKGLLHELGVELGLDFALGPVGDHPLGRPLHPGRSVAILLEGRRIGILGEVHPAVARRYKLKTSRPCYFELEADALLSDGHRPPYVEPSDTQEVLRSLAFGLPHGVDAGRVAAIARAAAPEWLDRIEVVDCFVLPPGDDGSPRSVTFELHYDAVRRAGGSRTAEEVNATTEAIVRAVLAELGPLGVNQR